MKLTFAMIFIGFIILLAGILAIYFYKKKKIKPIAILFAAVSILSAAMLITIAGMMFIGQNHGMYTKDITVPELIKGITNSPKEDELPEDITGAVILYYRFGCPDCEAIYPDLKSKIDESGNNRNIYWVSTKSEQGLALLEQYPVAEVPTGIYIRVDDYNGGLSYTQKPLHTTDAEGNTILDEAAINRLLFLQEDGR